MPSSPFPDATDAKHPPRPRLTLRAAITGHRWGASLESGAIPRIEAQLSSLLAYCEAVTKRIQRDNAGVFSTAPPEFVALSSLAEGGDRIFAQAALARGWHLESALPFAAEDYAQDFQSPEAKAEFHRLLAAAGAVLEIADPRSPDKDPSEAYETAGLVTLDHADLIVALWDGGESRGRGGTREMLDEAILRNIPVVWIHTLTDAPIALWDGEAPVALDLGGAHGEGASRLADILARQLAPPRLGGDPADDEAAARLGRFLAEREAQPPWWVAGYDLMLRLTAHRAFRFPVRLPAISSRANEWDGFLAALPPAGGLEHDLRDKLLPRFLWADHVADRLGRLYRGAYVLNFLLAAMSVFVGLLVLFYWDSLLIKTICAALEFTFIALILAITHAGARGHWHSRFIDARRLAEMLRHTRVLAPMGRTGGGGTDVTNLDPGERWTGWYARAARRELGLPTARADMAYLRRIIDATVDHEVKPQIAYHHTNHHRLHHVHHGLDHVGERLFYLTGVLCLVWIASALVYWAGLAQGLIKYAIKPALTFLGAVMPAIGAALAGIRAQGDFDASAKRSLATERSLRQLHERLLRAPPDNYRQSCLWQILVADAMASDLGSWRSLYANRPLTIPG